MIKKEDKYILLGKRIKEERKKANLTQEKFAEKINIGYKFLGNIERGEGVPSLETLIKIVEVLDISYDSLLAYNKKESSKTLMQIQHLLSDLSDKRLKEMLIAIKAIKNLIK